MIKIKIPYHKSTLDLEIEEDKIAGILNSKSDQYKQNLSEEDLVREALANTYGGVELKELAANKNRILIITSDHTRPVPSRITMPLLLEEMRSVNTKAKIKILIATGCHRPSTETEIREKFSRHIAENEEIINHDCRDTENMVYKGILPSGGELWLNSLIDWADLVISEGFIEPHFFAGFSGGRKSILPGIAAERTVLANHCSEFIASNKAKTGILDGNPIHKDMSFAAEEVGLKFILNVVLDENKKIIKAFAGEASLAHERGCEFLRSMAKVKAVKADIVVTSNGGYPLDQNVYQSVKGMTAAEACVNDNGVIIMVAACEDGHGGEEFYRWLEQTDSPHELSRKIACIHKDSTSADQWQAQILARVLQKCKVILVTDMCDPKIIKKMHMLHAYNLDEALKIAREITGQDAKVTIIPDGVGVIIEQ